MVAAITVNLMRADGGPRQPTASARLSAIRSGGDHGATSRPTAGRAVAVDASPDAAAVPTTAPA